MGSEGGTICDEICQNFMGLEGRGNLTNERGVPLHQLVSLTVLDKVTDAAESNV